jgi:hypothetical protein
MIWSSELTAAAARTASRSEQLASHAPGPGSSFCVTAKSMACAEAVVNRLASSVSTSTTRSRRIEHLVLRAAAACA